jgi:hypothetical protein
MENNRKYINFLSIVFILFFSCSSFAKLESSLFISPSQKHLQVQPLEEMKKAFEVRKIPYDNLDFFEEISKSEKSGFLGYHGDSLDYFIYQDIIRGIVSLIVGIPIRSDFHFLDVPLDPIVIIQTKMQFARLFKLRSNPAVMLYDSTFPLNFSIWDNADRMGLNSIEQFATNKSVKPLGYKRRLKWLFSRLEIKESEIENLFHIAQTHLKSTTGVLLQLFDQSPQPYSFAKKIAYPAYPNGLILENCTVDEYYMDENFIPPFPHEVRLLLNTAETLNPNSPLKIVRHTSGLCAETLSQYEQTLKNNIMSLSYNKKKAKSYRNELINAWGL